MHLYYKFNQNDFVELKKKLVIICDTREKENTHIINYFKNININYINQKLDYGDYSVKLDPSPSYGINRDLHFPISIERKASINELAVNFGVERERFTKEFERSKLSNHKLLLLVEDEEGYNKILTSDYRSNITSNAFLASLKTFESRFNFQTSFVKKEHSASFIFNTLVYEAREILLT